MKTPSSKEPILEEERAHPALSFFFCLNSKNVYNSVDFRSRRFACLRAVREPPHFVAGSHLSLPPAGVCAPSTPINKVTS